MCGSEVAVGVLIIELVGQGEYWLEAKEDVEVVSSINGKNGTKMHCKSSRKLVQKKKWERCRLSRGVDNNKPTEEASKVTSDVVRRQQVSRRERLPRID